MSDAEGAPRIHSEAPAGGAGGHCEQQRSAEGASSAAAPPSGADEQVISLVPDASTRRFYRHVKEGRTWVSMEYGHPLDASGEAYLQIAAYLASLSIPVPEVLEIDRASGRVILSDLGDATLESIVKSEPPASYAPLYREAVDLLARLQRGGREHPEPDRPCFQARLGAERLMFEMHWFREHFLEGFLALRLDEETRARLEDAFAALVADVAAHPVALCHRDFHCRNIMVKDRRLWLVDFQDARLGPRTYDLASLVHDSYVTLPDDLVGELTARFSAGEEEAVIRGELLVAGIQRNLKALGTFGYQIHARGNPRYAGAVDRTLGHLARSMPLSARHSELYRLLAPLLSLP